MYWATCDTSAVRVVHHVPEKLGVFFWFLIMHTDVTWVMFDMALAFLDEYITAGPVESDVFDTVFSSSGLFPFLSRLARLAGLGV